LRSREVIAFFQFPVEFPAALSPGVYSACNRNEYQKQNKKMFLGNRARPAQADNLIAIGELIV
jgi:hypothetical protein